MAETPLTDGGFEDSRPDQSVIVFPLKEQGLTSHTVLRAVSEFTDTPILDLPPLVDTIEVDFLDEMFSPDTDGSTDFSFKYYDCLVTVTADTVRVSDANK